MSSDDTQPLPSDVAEIVASARRIAGPSSEVRDRMRARLVATIPSGPGGGGDGGGGAGGATPSPWARAPWWTVAAALVVGVTAGRLISPSAETLPDRVNHDAPLATPSSSAHALVSAMIPVLPSPTDLPNAPAPPPPGASVILAGSIASGESAKLTGNMAAERRLLDVARTALGRGNGVDALAACDEHARKFPNGLLAEEREAIAVQALVESKRLPEARVRSDRFRQSYPKSILLPAVAAAVVSEP